MFDELSRGNKSSQEARREPTVGEIVGAGTAVFRAERASLFCGE